MKGDVLTHRLFSLGVRHEGFSRTNSRTWLALSFCTCMWWLARGYRGFGHDALFYAGDVLRRLGDGPLRLDIFFGAGTQGDFSAYPWVYAALTRHWGLSDSAFALTLIARFSWLAALATLCRAIHKGNPALLALCLSLLLPVYYDSHRLLSYGEPFETPRHWAEIAVMLSLAAGLRCRFLFSLILAVLACAIHPLMGLPGLAVTLLLLPGRLRNNAIAVVLAGIAVLTALRLGPTARLFHNYDSDWYTIVQSRNPMVLATEWHTDALARTAMWVFLLLATALGTPAGALPKRLAWAIFWTGGMFLTVWIAGCMVKNVLVIQLQLCRVLWIVQLVAPVLLLSLVAPKGYRRSSDWAFLALLGAALLSDLWTCLLLAVLAVVCRSGIPLAGNRLSSLSKRWIECTAYSLFAIVAISRLARIGFNGVAYAMTMSYPRAVITALITEPVLTCSVAAALFYAESRWQWSRYLTVRLIAIAMPLAALAFWIQQAGEVMRLERPVWSTALKRELPAGTTVYWDAGAESIWILIGRASYASLEQGAGALFSRAPAIELDRRLRRLEALRFIPDRRVAKGLMRAEPDHVVTLPDVKALCQDPVLDLVLLNGRKEGANQLFNQGSQSISIFRCAGFRLPSSGAA